MPEKPKLSIIILSYNVKELLLNCLSSIYDSKKPSDDWQIIVADNDSKDGSLEAAKEKFPEVETLQNGANLGFAKGNNKAIPRAKADFILFLNPDTKIIDNAIQKSLNFIKNNGHLGGGEAKLSGHPGGGQKKIGAITCRVGLPDGSLDYSCHRGFPTPWNSLSYFLGLSKLFPKSKFFSGYTATHLDISKTHEMDCGNGTFLLVSKKAGEQIGWWDEDYFWNGEDIEFCYSLKEKGWKIYFYPEAKIIHYKGSSSGLWSSARTDVDRSTKMSSAKNAVEAMRIFYIKHFYKKYPPIFRDLILVGIKLLGLFRLLKISLGLRYK